MNETAKKNEGNHDESDVFTNACPVCFAYCVHSLLTAIVGMWFIIQKETRFLEETGFLNVVQIRQIYNSFNTGSPSWATLKGRPVGEKISLPNGKPRAVAMVAFKSAGSTPSSSTLYPSLSDRP